MVRSCSGAHARLRSVAGSPPRHFPAAGVRVVRRFSPSRNARQLPLFRHNLPSKLAVPDTVVPWRAGVIKAFQPEDLIEIRRLHASVDYALLAGSVALFIILAAVMYLTRRMNWYELRLGSMAR
jgi:hypothetical protein